MPRKLGVAAVLAACLVVATTTGCSSSSAAGAPTAASAHQPPPVRYARCVIPKIGGSYPQPYVFFNGGVSAAVNTVCEWTLESTGSGVVLAVKSPAIVTVSGTAHTVRNRTSIFIVKYLGTRRPAFDSRHRYNWGNTHVRVELVHGVPRLPVGLSPLPGTAPRATVLLFQALPAYLGGIMELDHGSHRSFYRIPGTTSSKAGVNPLRLGRPCG